MSAGIYSHLHRAESSIPGHPRVTVHDPNGTVRGFIQRAYGRTDTIGTDGVTVIRSSYSYLWQPLDEHGAPLSGYQESRERAWEWVVER